MRHKYLVIVFGLALPAAMAGSYLAGSIYAPHDDRAEMTIYPGGEWDGEEAYERQLHEVNCREILGVDSEGRSNGTTLLVLDPPKCGDIKDKIDEQNRSRRR